METPAQITGPQVPILGLLTGVSYMSGLDYYKGINEQFMAGRKKGKLMPPNPNMVLASVNCDEYASRLVAKDWEGVSSFLCETGVARLHAAGATALVICSNTAHVAVPVIRQRFPDLHILHIADTTATALRKQGLKRVGLLGTEMTMRQGYLKAALRAHGVETIVPEADTDLQQIFKFIMDELSVGEFKSSTREFFQDQVLKLKELGAEGVILGCTEIELLLSQEDTPDVPLFASAALHITAAARVAAGIDTPEDYAPPSSAGSDTSS